jgi:hypothetical protein
MNYLSARLTRYQLNNLFSFDASIGVPARRSGGLNSFIPIPPDLRYGTGMLSGLLASLMRIVTRFAHEKSSFNL